MPKKIAPLTELQVRNAKHRATSYKLADGGGLYLEVLPSGGKSWRMKFRFGGTERRMVFGLWPDVSLKQARELRGAARSMVAASIDPGEKRRHDKVICDGETVRAANTFESVARRWIEKQSRRWSPGHTEKALNRLEKHLFPSFGGTLIDEMSPSALLGALQELETKGKHETAHRLRGLADNIFAYAIAVQLTISNPAAAIAKALAPTVTIHRAAIVDPDGVKRLLKAIWGYLGSPLVRGCLQITASTACRPGEARKLEWSEIVIDSPHGPLWVIPALKTKLRRDHLIPLAPQAVTILAGLRDLTWSRQFVFPNSREAVRPISDMAMNMALRKMGYSADQHCAHGFRSTFSTLSREAGWPHHVIEAALAHVQGSSVAQAYDRAQYIPERRKLLDWWADYLDTLKAGGKVVPIHRKNAS